MKESNVLPFKIMSKSKATQGEPLQEKNVIEMAPNALFDLAFTNKERLKLREMKRRQYGLSK